MYLRNYGFRKALLDKCLKSRVSEDPWKRNMVNGIKQCRTLNDTAFTIFTDHCQRNEVPKSLRY